MRHVFAEMVRSRGNGHPNRKVRISNALSDPAPLCCVASYVAIKGASLDDFAI
jgi:hypothetical protein